jgi:hypothetical protein
MLPKQDRKLTRTAFPDGDWVISGGRKNKATFLCEAGLSSQQLSERLLVEAAVSAAVRSGGSAFLYLI